MGHEDIAGWFTDANVNFYRKLSAPIKNGTIVEVGTFAGRSSISIGEICKSNNTVVYCVDHWLGSPEHFSDHPFYEDLKEVLIQAGWPNIYETFLTNIKREGLDGILLPLKMSSEEAAKTFTNLVDLVFIDASHTFEEVVKDIQIWLPHIKPGGIISGHDYSGSWPGVMKAVDYCFGKEFKRAAGNIWFKEV